MDGANEFSPARALPSFHALQSAYPDAPNAELRRFARKRPDAPDDAVKLYQDYVTWRAAHGQLPQLAQAYSSIPPKVVNGIQSTGFAKDGTPVIYMELARYDINAQPADTYVSAFCHLMDETYSRDVEGHLTVVIDVRTIEGMFNPKPMALMPFIKQGIKILPRMYPDRMKRIVVYPVPWMASMLVSMVKRMLDENTREKLMVVAGDEKSLDCPEELNNYLTLESLPRHCWHKNKSLRPAEPAVALDTSNDVTPRNDGAVDGGDDFFSASEGEEDDDEEDLEAGLVTMRFAVREPSTTEHSRRADRCWWRFLFRCRCCRSQRNE